MRSRQLGGSWLLATAFAALYLGLGRRALHGFDAFLALRATQAGQGQEAGHFLWFPLARAAWWGLAPLVPDAFTAMRVLSALGVAVAVWCAHRAAIGLRLGRRAAWFAAALGLLPVAVYFGATVEVDGLVLGAATAGWWSAVRLWRRPLLRRALVTGMVTGLTACLHGGGQLLLAAIAVLSASRALRRARRFGWRPLRAMALALGAAAGAHFGIYLLVSLSGSDRDGQLLRAGNTLALAPSLLRLPTTLWWEWLVPYAPCALLWVGALLHRHLRCFGLALALVWLAYLALTNAVMGHFEPLGPELWERGAFFVTLAPPVVALALLWLRPRAQIAAIGVAAAVALWMVRHGDWEAMPPGFAGDVLAVAARGPVEVYCSGPAREYGWIRKTAPAVDVYSMPELPREIALYERAGQPIGTELVRRWFDDRVQRARRAGASVAITDEALAFLRAAADPRLRDLADRHLLEHYQLEPVVQGAFRAAFVRGR